MDDSTPPEDSSQDSPEYSSSRGKAMAIFLGLGMALVFEVAIAAGAGFWIGNWVDHKLGCAPIGMILGLVLFLVTSITHAIMALKQAQANFEKNV